MLGVVDVFHYFIVCACSDPMSSVINILSIIIILSGQLELWLGESNQ